MRYISNQVITVTVIWYRLSTDQLLVTKEYQVVHVPEDLIETITDLSDIKVRIDRFENVQPVNWNYYSNDNNDDSLTSSNDKDISDDKSRGELDSSQQLNDLKWNKLVDHKVQDIVNEESSNSTNASVNELTSTVTSIPSLFS